MATERRRGSSGSLAILSEVADALARSADIDATLERILATAPRAARASIGCVLIQDPDLAGLQLAVTTGLGTDAIDALGAALARGDDPFTAAARERVPVVLSAGERGLSAALVASLGVRTLALRPLVVSRGGVESALGVIVLGWTEETSLAPGDDRVIGALADLAAVAVDRAQLASLAAERSEWFERMAHTDPLTGLANQRTFARVLELELARAARQGGEVSVALFDVDGFRAANESAGHEVGDDILRMVAAVLAESVRLVDTVARYGGDEFVLVAPGSAGLTVARRVVDGVAALPPAGGHGISVSAGVARFPGDGATGDELLAAAERALIEARAHGPGRLAEAPSAGPA